MQDLIIKINEELKTLRPLYIKEVYDYIKVLKEKQRVETEAERFVSSQESIDLTTKEIERPLIEYSDDMDW